MMLIGLLAYDKWIFTNIFTTGIIKRRKENVNGEGASGQENQ